MIGRFGSLIFSVSSQKVQTFYDFRYEAAVKVAEHEVPGWKGRTEITGQELDRVTLKIILMAELGVRPRAQFERILSMMKSKEAQYLIVGNKSVMDRRCIITSAKADWGVIHNRGEVSQIEVDLTFQEYQ